MHSFYLIYRAQLFSAIFGGKRASRKNKVQKAASFLGFAGVWLLAMAFAALYEWIYSNMFASVGAIDAFPVVVMALASILTMFSGITYTKNLLFSAKDYDMLSALPVSGRTIVAAKLTALYTLDLITTLIILLPCGVFYTLLCPDSSLLLFLFLSLFVPMLPTLFSAALSAIVSLIASRFHRANIVGTVLYAIFFVALMVGLYSTNMGEGDNEKMMNMLWTLSVTIQSYYPPAGWFLHGFYYARTIEPLLLFLGISLLAFLIVTLVLGGFYSKLHAAFAARTTRVRYKAAAGNAGAVSTLVKKDVRRYLSSGGVLLNQVTGSLLILVFTIMIYFQGDTLFASDPESAGVIAAIMPAVMPYFFAMFSAMSCCTNAAISLEGKTIGLLKSIPVSADTILRAKLIFHLIMTVPLTAICTLAVALRLHFSIPETIIMVVLPCLFSYNIGIIGLFLNLKKYNFAWTSEVMVVKNSFPVFVTIFGGMGAGMISVAASIVAFLLLGTTAVLWMGVAFCLLFLLLAILLRWLLRKNGERLFRAVEA